MKLLSKVKFSRKIFLLGMVFATWLEMLWQMGAIPFATLLDSFFMNNLSLGLFLLKAYIVGCNALCMILFVFVYVGRAIDIGMSLKYATAIIIALLWLTFYSIYNKWVISFVIFGMVFFTAYLLFLTGKSDDKNLF